MEVMVVGFVLDVVVEEEVVFCFAVLAGDLDLQG